MTRPYRARDEIQAEARDDLARAFREGFTAPILVAATGFGKTHLAAQEIADRVAGGQRVHFVAHLDSLLTSTARRLDARGIDYRWVRAGTPTDPGCPVQLVSQATAIRRLGSLPPADLLICDECHRGIDANRRVREALGCPPTIGLSATPARLDGRSLREGGYDTLVTTPDTCDLVEWGHLARLRTWSWPAPVGTEALSRRDLDSVAATGGIMSGSALLGDALEHWADLCREGGRIRPTIGFCAGVAAAEATAERWRVAGFGAMAVHGGSSPADRERAEKGLRDGSLDFVASADLWIAGVDVDSIGAVVCLRTTASLVFWLQMVGRGLRTSTAWPDCYLLDHAGNARRPGLGDPLQRRMHLWGLDAGQARRLRESCPPVVTCDRCYSSDVVGGVCRECGHQRVLWRRPRPQEVIPGQLEELASHRERVAKQAAQERERKRAEERACWFPGEPQRSRQAFAALGERRGYPQPWGWAAVQLRIREQRRRGA